MLLDVRPDQLQIVQTILQKHVPQYEVWVFGSRAKWTAKDYSDLDLCIVSEQPLSFRTLGALNEAFAESDLPWKVDVVDWATTSASFRKIIERDKVVVQERTKGSVVSSVPTLPGDNCAHTQGMPDSWRCVRLGQVAELLTGFPFKSSDYVNDLAAPRLLRGDNVVQGAVRWDSAKHWPAMKLQGLDRYCLKENDVVLAMDRPWIDAGLKYASITEYDLPALLVQRVARLRGTDAFDGIFLKYVIASDAFTKYVLSIQTGTAVPHISGGQIKDFSFALPPISEQKALASILVEFDRKVDINQRINAMLDAMARTLFQSWFVDFDPVRAKTEDRPPFGLDTKTAALFPDSFEDSDLGEIPVGWSATTLADIVTERTGKVGPGNGHVILSAVASGELKHSDEHFTKQVYSQDTSKYKRVEQWDYAYNPSRINIGSIGMLEEPIVGAVSPVYTVLRPAQGYEWFLRFFLDLPQTKAIINQFCSGSVRQSLSFKDFAAIPVVLPPKAVAEAFSRRWQELNTLRQQLDAQSRQLAEVRDTLLPKLMSGELRVPETLMA